MPSKPELWIWRHPKPEGVTGRCIGRTDVEVDARRARRLAYRIDARTRRAGLAKEVWTSPLLRSWRVGRALTRLGYVHHVDTRLQEMDFGDWDGRAWDDIPAVAIDTWRMHFAEHTPGGGESLTMVIERARAFLRDTREDRIIVGHAGWISALEFVDRPLPDAERWPTSIPYSALQRASVNLVV